MAYDVMTLTLSGAGLLASATTSDRLIIAGCDATQTFISQEDAVNVSSRPATPYSTTTDVRLEKATDNHVFLRAFFVAGQSTGGEVRSLYLYGHSESDDSQETVIAILSSQDPFHLPVAGEISNTYGVLVDITYNPQEGSVVTATTSVFATYGEFADWRDRTVTTHKTGQATVGDNQTIYGQKTFKSTIIGDTENNAIIKQTGTGYSGCEYMTQYGGFMGVTPYPPATGKNFFYSSVEFSAEDVYHTPSGNKSKDIGNLDFNVTPISNGISRYFGLASWYVFNNTTSPLSSVYAHMDRHVINGSEKEAGRVLLQADEFGGTGTAKLEVKVDFDAAANTYSLVSADADRCELKGTDPTDSNKYSKISVEKDRVQIIRDNGSGVANALIVEITTPGGDLVVYPAGNGMLGYGEHKFTAINATTVNADSFVGNLTGNATNDANGNAITSYFKTWDTPDDAQIKAKQGNGTTSLGVYLNTPASFCSQGKQDSFDSAYTRVGGIGLFLYTGSATSKAPGDTVSGSDLKPASIMKEYSTGDFKIISNGSVSGTWTLLSYFSTSSSGDAALVLAVKTSTT